MFSARRKSSINRALKEKQESRTSNGAAAAPEGGFAPSISQLMLTERSKSKPMSSLVGELSTDGAAAPAKGGAFFAAATTKYGGTPKPTTESLRPEKEVALKREDVVAPEEWDPFTEAELEVAAQIATWLGADEWDRLPLDILACFVRGYAYRTDWADAAFAYLHRQIIWRYEEMRCGALLDAPPPERQRWESLLQAGPIGFARHGHVVYLERTGAIPTKDLLGEFDEETFLKHLTFSREALRAYTTANCAERKKRLYKAIAVLDLKGFRMEHLKLMDLIKKANAVFAWHYPESIFKFVVINAPFIFSSAWKMAKAFVHPITAAKVHIIGSSEKEIRRTFDELGITLREGISLDALQTAKLDGWAAELAAARAGPHAKTLEGGYAPDLDLERMKGVDA